MGCRLSLQIFGTLSYKNTISVSFNMSKMLTIGTNSLCLFGPNLWGFINTGHIIHFFSLDKKAHIEQGFIVQGPTLTGTHETGTHGHNNLILAPSRTLKGQDVLKFRSESSI
jgi:hypothetical protein